MSNLQFVRILLLAFAIFMISLIITPAFGQISEQQQAQQRVEISIDKEGKVHIVHIIEPSEKFQNFDVIEGALSNLSIVNEHGKKVEFAVTDKEPLEFVIFPNEGEVFVEYDLRDVIFLENGRWTWDFSYYASTWFFFPEHIDLIYGNNRPVLFGETPGFVCHGCKVLLEYVDSEPVIIKKVEWKNKEYTVLIRTQAKIDHFIFDPLTTRIFFSVSSVNDPVTLIIPQELLPSPYYVYHKGQKIIQHQFHTNQTHVWLNFRPPVSGFVDIISKQDFREPPVVKIPDYIKQINQLWCNDKIEDTAYFEVIYYLIENDLLILKRTGLETGIVVVQSIPEWVKGFACYWDEGIMTDQEFVDGIKALVNWQAIKFQYLIRL